MTLARDRKQLTTALDGARARYALRFPLQKSGVLVVDLDPEAANLERARAALAAMPAKGPWRQFASWLATTPRPPTHTASNVLLTTTLVTGTPATGDGDEAALLAAIAEAPDDDAPRLVYADLLTARGDPRGELIVLQCRKAAGDSNARLTKRVEAMLATGWKAYAGELAPYAHSGAFRRGFVHSVSMTVAAFAKLGAHVFGALPTHTLAVANEKLTEADVAKLAANPVLARVRGLHISQGYDASERAPLGPLGAAPFWRLEEIDLHDCGHSSDDWTKLFAHLKAPKLTSIRLHRNYTSANIQSWIASNASLSNIRHLHESVSGSLDTELHTRDAYELLAVNRAIELLSIEGNQLVDDYTLAPMFARDTKAALKTLHLGMTGVTNKLLHTIAGSPKAKLLEYVEINDEGAVTIDGLRALLDTATNLEYLGVTSYTWSREASNELAALLLALPADRPLKRIALPHCRDGSDDASPELNARFVVEGY